MHFAIHTSSIIEDSNKMRTPIGALSGCTLVCLALAVPEWSSQQPLGHADNEASQDALPFSTSDLVEYIEGTMKKWHAPGMAVAIINGNVTWAEVSFSLPFSLSCHAVDEIVH